MHRKILLRCEVRNVIEMMGVNEYEKEDWWIDRILMW